MCEAPIKRGSRRDRWFVAASGACEARASMFVHAAILLHLLQRLVCAVLKVHWPRKVHVLVWPAWLLNCLGLTECSRLCACWSNACMG